MNRRPGTTFATGAAIGVVVAVLFVVFLVELSSNGTVKNQLGSNTFLAGRARDFAPQIAAQGPILLPDLLGKDRPLFLQHVGSDVTKGWVAIQATVPGMAPACVLSWEQGPAVFAFKGGACGTATYPADGTGLVRYPATVLASGRINVDLHTPLGSSTTATAPTTTTTTTTITTG